MGSFMLTDFHAAFQNIGSELEVLECRNKILNEHPYPHRHSTASRIDEMDGYLCRLQIRQQHLDLAGTNLVCQKPVGDLRNAQAAKDRCADMLRITGSERTMRDV